MDIRNAERQDLPFILDIMNEAILNTTSIYEYEIRSPEFIENWFDKKITDKEPVLVYMVNDELAAYGTYGRFRPRAAYQFSIEHSIYVKPEFHRQGIGSFLLKALIEKGQRNGFHTMIAGIDANNQSSYDFHLKLGFVEVARLKEVGYKFDQWLDLIFMQKMLSSQ